MPKQVDHQQRRTLIAGALCRVAARRGLQGVSVRHVAAEAGVSAGMVQHYFRTKDEMMAFALDGIREQAEARLASKGELLATASPGAAVRELLIEMLPLDEQRRLEGHVAVALTAYAAVNPSTDNQQEDMAQLEEFLTQQIRTAQDEGTASPDLEPGREAVALIALVEGLNVITLVGHQPSETTQAVFDARLRALFGEPELGCQNADTPRGPEQ